VMLKKKISKLGKRSGEAFKGVICQIQLEVFVIKKSVKIQNMFVPVKLVRKKMKFKSYLSKKEIAKRLLKSKRNTCVSNKEQASVILQILDRMGVLKSKDTK
jgi:hypothetical protein